MELHDLGFDQWHKAHDNAPVQDGCGVARICAVDRGSYRIKDAMRDIPAELSGKFAYASNSPDELPCVGDWATVSYYNKNTAALIHRVFPRKTFLRRKSPGETIAVQMIAANIDTAFLVQSCHFDFNPSRLERYLVMAAEGGVTPIIVLTKTDLISQEALEHTVALLGSVTNARVIALSNVTGVGCQALQQTLASGKTYCLLGSSGVGKTTLLNRLVGQEAFATKTVSSTGEGIHTTTRRHLVVLSQGAMLIDTPGMRELGLLDATEALDGGFEDIAALAAFCRFADCSHGREPGCAVRAAREKGELAKERFDNYQKLKKESAYYAMTALDKRKKDKALGRFMKSMKKRMQG